MIEPIEMKGGDKRVLVNGLSLPVDYRIVCEENYKKLKRAFDLANISKSDFQEMFECLRDLMDLQNGPLYPRTKKRMKQLLIDVKIYWISTLI